MSDWDDMLDDDNEEVFVDTDENGEEIEWDGETEWTNQDTGQDEPITANVQSDNEEDAQEPGVYYERKTMFISFRKIDRPVPGSEHALNGEIYYVQSVGDSGGLLEIGLLKMDA